MSQTHKLRFGSTPAGGTAHNQDVDITSESVQLHSFTVAGTTTDQQQSIAVDISQLKSLYIHSDQNITCETNSSSAPQETLTILANKPLQWYSDMPGVAVGDLFAGDVTSTYWTNAGATLANVRWEMCLDSSP